MYQRFKASQQNTFHLTRVGNQRSRSSKLAGVVAFRLLRYIVITLSLVFLLIIIPVFYYYNHHDPLDIKYPLNANRFNYRVDTPLESHTITITNTNTGSSSRTKTSHIPSQNEQYYNTQTLPQWIQEYLTWHREIRKKYPGKSLIEDANAPPVLVRTCLGLCGGLHDRLGQLPLDLYIAYKSKRILLIKWVKPQPLEEFLVPPDYGLDWTFPLGVQGWGTHCSSLNECANQIRSQPSLKGNLGDDRHDAGTSFLKTMIDDNIDALTIGMYSSTKAVTFAIVGHLNEHDLEMKLTEMGEKDMIHGTTTFGNIFHHFFKLNPKIEKIVQDVSHDLGLIPGQYAIAHSRVRHPKAYPIGESFNGQYISNADKTGLPFMGRFKDLAVEIASKAIACAAKVQGDESPIYFMADSSDLVTYLTRDLKNDSYISKHLDWFSEEKSTNATAKALVSKYKVVARDQDIPNAHLDKNKGRPPEAYYATFVDLFLSIRARCVSFGIGNYALFATKISHTSCKIRYAKELWGDQDTEHHMEAPFCEL